MKINMGSGVSDGTRTKLVFVVWAPQTASIKQKMVSASSKDALKKKLDGIQVFTVTSGRPPSVGTWWTEEFYNIENVG